jgi:hypothetical protein
MDGIIKTQYKSKSVEVVRYTEHDKARTEELMTQHSEDLDKLSTDQLWAILGKRNRETDSQRPCLSQALNDPDPNALRMRLLSLLENKTAGLKPAATIADLAKPSKKSSESGYE